MLFEENKKNKVPLLLTFYFVLNMFYSMHASLFWHISNAIAIVFCICLSIIVYTSSFLYFTKQYVNIIFCALIAILLATRGNIFSYLNAITTIIPFALFLLLKDEYKLDVYCKFKKIFVIVISISFLAWGAKQFGVSWISFLDGYGDSDTFDTQYLFNNHIFFVECIYQRNNELSNRFQSVFLEPSIIACLIVAILFTEKFKHNSSNWILVISLFFTYSLAGYILFIVSFLFSKIETSRLKIGAIIAICTIVSALYLYGKYYDNGNNVINERIIERLEYDDEVGNIQGYNRTTADFDNFFYQNLDLKTLICGDYDNYKLYFDGESNVGWKPYLYKYGIFALLFYIFYLYSFFHGYVPKSYHGLVFFMLYVIIFQRGNFVIWMSAYMIVYAAGHLKFNKNNYY